MSVVWWDDVGMMCVVMMFVCFVVCDDGVWCVEEECVWKWVEMVWYRCVLDV